MSAGEIEALVNDLQEVLSELTMMFYSYMY